MAHYAPGSSKEPDATITFAERPEQPVEMDLFYPRHVSGMRPAVLFVHGGGWSSGGRHQFHWHAGQLAQMGYFAASVGYRLSGTAPYPAAVDDVQEAVRFLRAHSHEYAIDGNRIAAFGSSAGGHLVAVLGACETRATGDDVAHADISSRVNAVIDVHGAHNLPVLADHRLGGTVEKFMGVPFAEAEDTWREASPEFFIDEHAPPMLLFHDPADQTVPYDQSVTLASRLMQADRSVSFEPTPGSGHGFVYNPGNDWTQRIWPIVTAWLSLHL